MRKFDKYMHPNITINENQIVQLSGITIYDGVNPNEYEENYSSFSSLIRTTTMASSPTENTSEIP